MAAHAVDGAAALHLQIEAMKLFSPSTYAHVADPIAMRLTGRGDARPSSISKKRAALIDPNPRASFGEGHGSQGGTIIWPAADDAA